MGAWLRRLLEFGVVLLWFVPPVWAGGPGNMSGTRGRFEGNPFGLGGALHLAFWVLLIIIELEVVVLLWRKCRKP